MSPVLHTSDFSVGNSSSSHKPEDTQLQPIGPERGEGRGGGKIEESEKGVKGDRGRVERYTERRERRERGEKEEREGRIGLTPLQLNSSSMVWSGWSVLGGQVWEVGVGRAGWGGGGARCGRSGRGAVS